VSSARQRVRPGSGIGRWAAVVLAALVLAGSSFGAGVYVGQRWSTDARRASVETPRPAPSPRKSGLVEPVARRDAGEKLTFYQTLTAPLAPMPSSPPATPPPRPAPERRPAERPAAGLTPPASMAPDPQASDGREWTVQLGVFRDRAQADRLRRDVTGANVVEAPGPDGRLVYRVHVGVFRTRAAADQTARRVAAEQRVPTYVTAR
jgi:cell division protein FtsN